MGGGSHVCNSVILGSAANWCVQGHLTSVRLLQSCVNLVFLLSVSGCLDIWGIAGPKRTTLPKSSHFLERVRDAPYLCKPATQSPHPECPFTQLSPPGPWEEDIGAKVMPVLADSAC